MATNAVTLFTWGYEGWGNWTPKLVQAVDLVETSRGWKAPVFLDIRASRKVRAEGFRERAFENLLGPERYRWFQKLGNSAILNHEKQGSLLDPGQAAALLDLALELHAQRRRVIYFCSCVSPTRILLSSGLTVFVTSRIASIMGPTRWSGATTSNCAIGRACSPEHMLD